MIEEDGRPYARVRYRGLRRVALERSDGTPLGTLRAAKRQGKVEDAAGRDDVLILIFMFATGMPVHMGLNLQLW